MAEAAKLQSGVAKTGNATVQCKQVKTSYLLKNFLILRNLINKITKLISDVGQTK